MSKVEREGNRKKRDHVERRRIPELGYYFIVTDTKETEQNYMLGLRDSIPKELQSKLVIKVVKTTTKNLVTEALNLASLHPQFGEIWIVFDRDQVKNFDEIIYQAYNRGIKVGWTNPCIEAWFHAYYGVMPNCQDSVSCCNSFSTVYNHITGQKYVKSDQHIYEKLNRFGNEHEAISLAKQKFSEQSEIHNAKPSEMSPCTTVHLLVNEIKSKTLKLK